VVLGGIQPAVLPLLDGKKAIDGRTTIYICHNKTCQRPVFSVENALHQLQSV